MGIKFTRRVNSAGVAQVIRSGGQWRWTGEVDSASGQFRGTVQVDSAGGQCKWTVQGDSAGGQRRWTVQRDNADRQVVDSAVSFDLPEVHILEEDRQASAPLSARLGINPKHPRAN